MLFLADDKCDQDIVDLSKVHLSVDVFEKYLFSQHEYFDSLMVEEVNLEDIVRLYEKDYIFKVYEEVVNTKDVLVNNVGN